MVSFRVSCVAEDGGLRTRGSFGEGARRGLEILDGDVPERTGRRAAEQAVRSLRAVLGDPTVVGVEAGLLEVQVVVVADHHPNRRIDDLGGFLSLQA